MPISALLAPNVVPIPEFNRSSATEGKLEFKVHLTSEAGLPTPPLHTKPALSVYPQSKMRFSSFITAALPILSCLATFTLARPIQSNSAELDARSIPSDASDSLNLRSLADYVDIALEARARGAPYPVKQKNKISAAAQQKRKADRRTVVKNNQAANAAKKASIKAMGPAPMYKTPRGGKSGYRAKERAAGTRRPKEPKTPKPNMAKGAAKTNKARLSQERANRAIKDRKRAGKIMFADAKAKYGKTTGLPSRKTTYTANGHTVTGKDVRTAVFNTHHFQGNNPLKKPGPKTFDNRLQGPAASAKKAFPKMKGPGQEFPVTDKKGGHQGGDVGTMRVITQHKEAGGTSFKGVVAHDASKNPGDIGYNDHHPVQGKKQKNKPRYS